MAEHTLDEMLDHRVVAINYVIGDLDTMAHLIDVPEQHDEFLAARRNLEASRDALITIKRYRHPEGLSDPAAQPPGPENQQLTSEGSASNAANQPQSN